MVIQLYSPDMMVEKTISQMTGPFTNIVSVFYKEI